MVSLSYGNCCEAVWLIISLSSSNLCLIFCSFATVHYKCGQTSLYPTSTESNYIYCEESDLQVRKILSSLNMASVIFISLLKDLSWGLNCYFIFFLYFSMPHNLVLCSSYQYYSIQCRLSSLLSLYASIYSFLGFGVVFSYIPVYLSSFWFSIIFWLL